MRHSHLNKRKAFDFIATELEQGRQVSDQQLMELCGLFEREQIKTLLADLADEGAISVSWDGPVRTIALGPRETKKPISVRPTPTIVRPAVLRRRQRQAAINEETAAARIMSIMKGKPAAQPKRDAVSVLGERAVEPGGCAPPVIVVDENEPQSPSEVIVALLQDAERPEVETAETKGDEHADALTAAPDRPSRTEADVPPVQAEEGAAKRGAAPPRTVKARRSTKVIPEVAAVPARCDNDRASSAGGREIGPRGAAEEGEHSPQAVEARPASFIARPRKQLNLQLPSEIIAELDEEASGRGIPTGTLGRMILLEALDARRCDTDRKHKLKARLVQTAREDGFDLADFVTLMIERGFAAYSAERHQMAEAAE